MKMDITGYGYDFESALSNAHETAENHCMNKLYEYSYKWNIKDLKGFRECKINPDTYKKNSEHDVEIVIEIEDLLHE